MAEILHQLRLVVYPIIHGVLFIPGGCLGFLPSTVSPNYHLPGLPMKCRGAGKSGLVDTKHLFGIVRSVTLASLCTLEW